MDDLIFIGVYDILFSGREEYTKVTLTGCVVDHMGHPIYLKGPADVVYNWSNIVIVRKAIR